MTEFRNPVDGNVLNVWIEGPEDAPAILLAHSIGCDLRLWDAQAETLKAHYRIIRYDARGHGSSSATEGAYSIEQLASDAIAILDQLGIDAVHLCGLSLGGTLGMWMAINAPERLKSVTLADTAARLGTIEGWQSRIDVVTESGTESIADLSMPRFFSEAFIERAPEVIARFRQQLVEIRNDL